jgi:hypothetical protein
VPRVLTTCREWDKASGLDVKGFGVRRLGTFRWGQGGYEFYCHTSLGLSHMGRLSPARRPSVLFHSRAGWGGDPIPRQHGLDLRMIPFG